MFLKPEDRESLANVINLQADFCIQQCDNEEREMNNANEVPFQVSWLILHSIPVL